MGLDMFRGWVAITMVQQLGVIVQVAVDSDSLQRAFFSNTVSKRSARPFVTIFLVAAVQQLIVKLLLQVDFKNRSLHIIHGLFSLVFLIYFSVETFLYEYFTFSTASVMQIGFSAVTAVASLITYLNFRPEPEEKEHRPRRITAKHYMETQVKGLVNTEDHHELKKNK